MLLLLERLNLFNKNVPQLVSYKYCSLKPHNGGKGSGDFAISKNPFEWACWFWQEWNTKGNMEIYHLLLFFAARSWRNWNEMSATIKKYLKSSLVFNRCVYVLKHKTVRLCTYVLTPSLPRVSHHVQIGLILISQVTSLRHLDFWGV